MKPTGRTARTTALAALVLSVLWAAPAAAQERDDPDDDGGGGLRVAVQAGYQAVDLEALNARLEERAIPTFGEDYLTIGATAGLPLDPVLLEAEAEALVQKERTTEDFRRTLGGGRIQLNLGYPVYATDRLRLRPYGGLGVGTIRLESVEHGPVPFDELLEDSGPATRLHNTELVLQLGLGGDVDLDGWTLGARAGYSFAPNAGDWKAEDVQILEGPDVGIEGFFVKGSVGFGGWSPPGDGGEGGDSGR